MPHERQRLGKQGEDLAAQYLQGEGIIIIDKNYHFSRYAEIDLIGRDNNETVFIEVKTRACLGWTPEEAVTKVKQEKIRQAAETYILAHPQLRGNFRFDVVAINFDIDGRHEIKHWRNV